MSAEANETTEGTENTERGQGTAASAAREHWYRRKPCSKCGMTFGWYRHYRDHVDFRCSVHAKRPPLSDWPKSIRITPMVKWALCRAVRLSIERNDKYVRTAHVSAAIEELSYYDGRAIEHAVRTIKLPEILEEQS